MEPITVRPRVMPRDWLDVVVCLGVALVQLPVLIGAPAGVVVVLTGSVDVASLVALALLGVWLLFSVRYLRCDAQGVHLVRVLGSPKVIPWAQIDSVEEAPRQELVVRGWLWPLFPAREMTTSVTGLGHYRIRSNGRDVYYPPDDSRLFLDAIERGRTPRYQAPK